MAAPHISPYSGSWYPEGRAELDQLLDSVFARSCERTGEWLPAGARGFVVPHAGPRYSGTVAAAVFRSLARERPRRVVLLGFSHRGGGRGVEMPDVEAVATPLGSTALDTEFVERLARKPPFARVEEDRLCDHSAEIQLPFLERAVPGVPVALLYVGALDPSQRQAAAETLAALWEPGTVYIASSDLTHFGRGFGYQPFPADSDTAWRLRELDFESIAAAGSLDAALFQATLAASGDTVCGVAPISLLIETLRRLDPDLYQKTLDYETSGDITGDYSHCVSYGALGYYPACSFAVGAEDAAALFESAQATLAALRQSGRRQPIAARGGSPALEARRGLFVSLHRGDELLGCIGNKEGNQPLRTAVAELTLSAALDDPRFEPAAKAHGDLSVEISILTPMKLLSHPDAFQIGRHGAFLEAHDRRGLLLPQVAQGHEWDGQDFLQALSRKAGLGSQAWSGRDARLFCFEAQILTSNPASSG
jgi:AmmeMemoRadiSam system protein B/AmmeMemoRadiSam system protein A